MEDEENENPGKGVGMDTGRWVNLWDPLEPARSMGQNR